MECISHHCIALCVSRSFRSVRLDRIEDRYRAVRSWSLSVWEKPFCMLPLQLFQLRMLSCSLVLLATLLSSSR